MLALALPLGAQLPSSANGMPGRHAIVGVVHDRAGRPVEHAEVLVGTTDLQATSDSTGYFHVENVDPGRYPVIARRVGYAPCTVDVTLGDQGAVIDFVLVALPPRLAEVMASAVRGGVSGVVQDSSHHPLDGVDVRVLGAGIDVASDSAGAFFAPVHAGHFVLRLERAGYAPRLVSMTIPPDSGREVVIGMAPTTRALTARQSSALFDMGERVVRRGPRSKLFTREDLVSMDIKDVDRIAGQVVVHPVDRSCFAVVDGNFSVPIWTIDATDLEMLEVYANDEPSQSTFSRSPTPRRPPAHPCPSMYAWSRT